MKKALPSKWLSLLLMLLTVFSVFVACSDGEKIGGTSTNNSESVNQDIQSKLSDDTENPDYGKTEEEIDYDYGGYEFTFICQPYKENSSYPVDYMVADDKGESQLLDAVYDRNAVLENKYNVHFVQAKTEDLVTTVRTQVLSGTTEFDVIVGNCQKLATFAKDGLLLDLTTVEQFDLGKSYWDQNANEQLRIGNKLYFTNCDFNIQEIAFVVYFNKEVVKEHKFTSPYEYIENNNWTLDTWSELVKAVSVDKNGDGRMTEGDQFGTLYEYHNPRMFLYGCGIRATTNDETGYPVVTLMKDADRTTNAYDKLKNVFSDQTVSFDISGNISDTHGYADKWDYARSLFMQNLFLFHYSGTDILFQFGDMEGEFGIVPFPKYDPDQDGYYSMYPLYCAMVALPSTLEGEKLEMVATIFEDVNFCSKDMVKKYWYEKILTTRQTRDDESAKYLDVIKEGRVYDLAMYYNFGGIRTNVLDVNCSGANINTAFKKFSKAIEADIKHIYNEFKK